MTACVHAIPGRVRFVMPEVRSSDTLARSVANRMRRVDGVHRVEIRRRSASIVIHFDPVMLSIAEIRGLMTPDGPAAADAAPIRSPLGRAARKWGVVIGGAALNALVGNAVKTGVVALLAKARA